MATSEVVIANRALQILGSPNRIESLAQDHPNARTMNAAFVPVRNALIRKYKWNFAKKRGSVAADAVQTTWGTLNRYTLPADFARLIRNDETGMRLDWQIEGRFIVTKDAAPLEFKYIAIIEDPNEFDPLFDEAFAHELALATCKEVTGSNDNKADIRVDLRDALNAAKQNNAYEEDAEQPLEDDWLLARR